MSFPFDTDPGFEINQSSGTDPDAALGSAPDSIPPLREFNPNEQHKGDSEFSDVDPRGIDPYQGQPRDGDIPQAYAYDDQVIPADRIDAEASALQREVRGLRTENTRLRAEKNRLSSKSNFWAITTAGFAALSGTLLTALWLPTVYQNTKIYAEPTALVETVPQIEPAPTITTTVHLITYGPQVTREEAENKLNRLSNCLGQDIGEKLYVEKLSKGFRPTYNYQDEDLDRAEKRRDRHDNLLLRCNLIGPRKFTDYTPAIINFDVTK